MSGEDDPETAASAELAGWFIDPTDLTPQTRRAGVVTGLTLLVARPDSSTPAVVEQLAAALADDFRIDVLVAADDAADLWADDLRSRLDDLALRHRLVAPGAPGAPAALDALAGIAGGEFVMTVRGPVPDVSALVPGLLRVWIDGGDALVLVDRTSVPVARPSAAPAEVVAEHLVDLLGVGTGPALGAAVVRRWLARRLTSDLAVSGDPATDVIARLRDVGATLVELPVDPA